VALGQLFVGVFSTGSVEEPAYIGVTYAWEGLPIPAMHVRLVSEDRTRILEGEWVVVERGLGMPYRIRERAFRDSDHLEGEWLFKTGIPWASIRQMRPMVAPYSPAWNCQSVILLVTRTQWGALGLAGWIMAPVLLWGFVMSSICLLGAALTVMAIDIIPILGIILDVVAPETISLPVASMAYWFLEGLVTPGNDYWALPLRWFAGVGVGWGAQQDVRMFSYAIRDILALPLDSWEGWDEFVQENPAYMADKVIGNLYMAKKMMVRA